MFSLYKPQVSWFEIGGATPACKMHHVSLSKSKAITSRALLLLVNHCDVAATSMLMLASSWFSKLMNG